MESSISPIPAFFGTPRDSTSPRKNPEEYARPSEISLQESRDCVEKSPRNVIYIFIAIVKRRQRRDDHRCGCSTLSRCFPDLPPVVVMF